LWGKKKIPVQAVSWLTPPPIKVGTTAALATGHAIFSNNGQLTVLNATVSSQSGLQFDDDIAVVQSSASTPTSFTLENTIATGCAVFGNSDGITESFIGNLIQENGGCGGSGSGADAQLGELQDNGGFTPTMAIPFGGVAMSAADSATSLATDQRGVARPQADGWDIGAYQVCRRSVLGSVQPWICGETRFAGFPTSPLTIQASNGTGGTVSPTPGTYNAPQNTVVVLSAMPAAGYYLKKPAWTGNVALPNNPTTTIIIGDQAQTVTANFQLHDFSLSANPTTFTLPLGGVTAVSGITAFALGDFADKITLAAMGQPAGVAVSLSANPLTPVVGTPAASTLTITVGPSVTPQSFTESVTGNSTGLSGVLTHSAQLTVTFTMTAAALVNIINQDQALGCIDNSGIVQSLIAKVNAYQTLASGGHIQGAANVLAAFQYEVLVQTGQHIATTCTDPVGGNQFYTGQTLITDAQSLQATLGTQASPNPIMGWVVKSSYVGIAGATVNVLSGKSVLLSTTTDAVGFYYFDASQLAVGTNYTAQVTLPKGYKSSTPASQAFTGSTAPVKLADFLLN
jgi:hypothetical protein